MAVEWFCKVMGSEVGPLTQDQLVEMVRQHHVNPEDLIRRNSSQWVPAFEVKGLFEAAAKPAPAPEAETIPEASVPPSDNGPSEAAEAATSKAIWTNADVTQNSDDLRFDHEANPASDWYCIAAGEKRGPLPFAELRALAITGELRDRDRVWRGSSPKWKKAGEVKGLMAQ